MEMRTKNHKDCFCTSRTQVESLRPEKQSETSTHQNLVDEPTLSLLPPSTRASEVICSTNVSHYELQVEIGQGDQKRNKDLTFSKIALVENAPKLERTFQMVSIQKRSIKASHILISGDGLVTLSGLSHLHSLVKHGQKHRAVYDFPQFSTSVQPWLSPELLRQDLHGYNVKSDIYSVGITACELASGQVPFQDMHRTQMLLQKLKGPPYSPLDISIFPQSESRMKNSRSGVDSGIGESVHVSSGTRTVNSDRLQTPPSKTFSPAFLSLVQLCLQQDPEKR
eukprot:bmy_17607T0